MKKHRVFQLFLLIFVETLISTTTSSTEVFEFAAPLYNLSVEENSVGSRYARSENSTKIGVPLPEKDANCKLRIAEIVGEKSSLFKAHSRQVGDFVFLRIRYKGDNPLNRELKDFYDILVKATCKRRDLSNLETTTRVHLRVIDRNDASPVFLVDEQGYSAEIDDELEPFSNVLRVEASDADIGLNSAIYFSLLNRSHEFFVEPVSGWIRTLKRVKAGSYQLKVKAEDRSSRLLYFDENEVQPSWTADVLITVRASKHKKTVVHIDAKKVHSVTTSRQVAAILTLENAPERMLVGLKDSLVDHWFEVEKENNHRWVLFMKNGSRISNNTNVTLTIGEDYVPNSGFSVGGRHLAANLTAIVPIQFHAERSVSIEENDEVNNNIKLDEMVPIGYIVSRFRSKVGDSNDVTLLRYSISNKNIENSNSTFPFSIGARNGLLRVAGKLGAERSFTFTVTASLHNLPKVQNSSKSVTVTITDGNNHAPVWAAKWMRQAPIPISSTQKVGTFLLKVDAADQDEGENGNVVYKMSSELESIPILIEPRSGEITLFEKPKPTETSWPVTIWAMDLGVPMSRASGLNLVFYKNGTKVPAKPKPIIITESENRHTPVFTSFPDVVEVSEDVPIGTVVAKLMATDEDFGYNGLIRYVANEIKNVASEVLKVDLYTGEVSIASDLTSLMSEKKESIDLQVQISAIDAGHTPKSVSKTMKLRVLDVNNHSPKFDESAYSVKVSESEKIGKKILKVSATDFDGGVNGKVKYSLASPEHEVVSVDESGVVKISKQLDREEHEKHFITVVATDGGNPKRMAFVNVTVEVEDVNDNAPRCLEINSRVKIPEDLPHGAFVACMAASDRDSGSNSKLKFSINTPLSSIPFRIDHHTGCVFVHAPETPLDFHKTQYYNLSIDVADHGEPVLSTTCNMHIELIDVVANHFAIEFDDVAKEASVYENSEVGTEVIMIEAREMSDEKKKTENLEYAIVGGDGWPFFSIDNKGTVRTTSVLDRESKSAYWITVEARDGSSEQHSSHQKRVAIIHVFIRILDRNDHRPVPKKPMYVAEVPENSEANVVIVKIEATDADDVNNEAAAPLTFKIERGDPQSFFRIDMTSGYITTSGVRRLDREKQAEHELWVAICDGGEPQLCSNVVVVVKVTDENDNAPAFTQAVHHYTVRGMFVGKLCRIFAVDADEGDNSNLFYNITEGDPRFSVDQHGIISTSGAIHGDESYALTVQATDRGAIPQYTATRVILTATPSKKAGAKNKPPVIAGRKSEYVIPISDADQVGLTVGKLDATDEDGDDLWWSISSGDENYVFDVRQDSGQLLLAKKVDNLNRGDLRLNVSVTDGTAWDHTIVLIQVSRQISQRPKFSASHYQTDVSERTAVGTQIYTLKAAGETSGLGTKPLVYSLFSIDDIALEDKIRVEPSSGNVVLMESLDYEQAQRLHAIVQVQQAGMRSFATFILKIIDENDNAPYFVKKTEWAFVDETDPVDKALCVVTAFDKDQGQNSVITYSIVSGNEENLFKIDAQSGQVSLAKKLNPESHVESILLIRASDSAENFLKDEMTLRIRSSNAAPEVVKFERETFRVSIHDSTPPGSPVVALSVLHYGPISYSFLGNCSHFEVHPLSGAVHIAKWLTKELSNIIECTVQAKGTDGSTDEAKIVAKIIRTNQHSPVFRQEVYRGRIRENSEAGSVVLTESYLPLVVSATDEDTGPNGLVAYRMMGSSDEHFIIDEYTGAIRTKKSTDFEKQKEHQFYVQSFDMGQPSRRSLLPALVIVTVIDENDEAPQFNESALEASLILPTANGVHIAEQTAHDKDTVGSIRYYIKDPEANKLFVVDSRSGEVTVKNADLLKTTSQFEVFASDGVRSTSYSLKVLVTPMSSSGSGFQFTRTEYEGSMVENTTLAVGSIIFTVHTKGSKVHTPVVYSIVNPRPEFFIHPGSGVISSTGMIVDREQNSIIRLVVQAKTIESKPKFAQCLVNIHVQDINDEAPVFLSSPYDVTVSSDTAIGSEVLNIQAIDRDEGENGKVQYESANLPDVFELKNSDRSVRIVLKKKFPSPEEYSFSIVAKDSGNPMKAAEEAVRIRAVDKARPVFEQNLYKSEISKSTVHQNTLLAKVLAKSNLKTSKRKGLIGYQLIGDSDFFSVDFITGEVRVSGELTEPEYTFEVEAMEVTQPKMTARTIVKVSVQDPQTDRPTFSQSNYSVVVPESVSVGHQVLTVQANSSDDSVEYSLGGADTTGSFSIEPETGVITVAKPLDYENRQEYHLKVLATSRENLQSEAPLVVYIDDVNDETPIFLKSEVTAQVDDASIPGQLITIMSATDPDTVSSLDEQTQKLLFNIVEGDETLFDIEKSTGIVTLARPIEMQDLAEDSRKVLNVSVTDGMFTAYAKLSVDILRNGATRPPPRFEQSHYVASALENTIVNKSTLLTVSVKGGIPPLRYSLGSFSAHSNSKDSWPVAIEKKTGRIHVSRVLNYHNDKRYQIPLVVEDATKRRAFSMLTLSVIDINDKPPFFVLPFYSTSISESAKEGDTVLMVSATDEDDNDAVEYSLIDSNDFFTVHPRQGTITVSRKLEHKAGVTISLTVKATDSANPPHHATTTVEINIANDNVKVPRFSNSHYLFAVQEDADVGNIIGRVQQMEVEIDEVRFTIVDPPANLPFSVERATGKLIVKSSLDRERKNRWKMTIRADAVGGVHAVTTVTVDVLDVNDNAPAFHGSYERLAISEDAAVGTSVTIFSALDKDDSPSGKIRFSLAKNSPNFQIDENSGWLTVSSQLDREKEDHHDLVVRATDEGGFNTELPISVSVMDVNDSPPRFDKVEYAVQVDASTTDPILRFVISDDDLPPHNESQLFITSGNEEGVFMIDANSYLKIQRPEIVGKKDSYDLKMTAFDGRFHADAKVSIKILKPQNSLQCPPKQLNSTVSEKSKKGAVVIGASSLASQSNITFEMKDITEPPFVMNFRNGIVKVTDTLDYEKTAKFDFTRVSLRNGEVLCQEQVQVSVKNENDNRPQMLEKEITVSIEENLPTSEDERQFLTRVVAIDKDGSTMSYKLSDDHNGTFKVDEKYGVVTVVKTLDSESRSNYQLIVIASDGKFEDKAIIDVSVLDQNDNAPKFEKSTYSMKVMESESIGYQLAHIQAIGGDANETIEYSLKASPHSSFFSLDKSTGVLTLAQQLDFERTPQIQLQISATDSGVPPLSSEASVNIVVMDENDNAPKFAKTKYTAKISENVKVGSKVTEVKATDSDAEHFGRVSYSIQPAEGNELPFTISETGEIKTTGPLDYEKVQKYSMKIVAKDGGSPPLLSEAMLEIHVEDENDNSPMFEDCNMTAVVQGGDHVGTTLIQFVITDADGPKNAGPFSVVVNGDGSKSFRVTEDLKLVATKKLQHSKKDKFLLTVVAKDVKGRATDCPLTIYIKEESRHAPMMKPMIIRVNSLFNEMQSGVIGKLRAVDEDAEDILRFGIVDGSTIGPLPTLEYPKPFLSKPHLFKVDTKTGELWSEHSISPGLHTFNVTVADGKFTTVSYVEVYVTSIDNDIIDHAVSIRVRSMSVDEFMQDHVQKFRSAISHHLNLNEESVQLISVQAAKRYEQQRARRATSDDVEILMTAQRGHGRGYLKPDHIYSRLKADFQNLNDQSGRMNFQLITEMCTTGACLRGECREVIELIEDEWTKVSTDTYSFVSPLHNRQAECLCPDGFGGRRCELEVNPCARSPCEHWQVCVPSVHNNTFECVCPLGMQGDKCSEPSCKTSGKCLEEAELSVGGDGYFEISLPNEVETRMELEIEIKTTSSNGIIMHAIGRRDFHKLSIVNGSVEYHWDAGSGPGVVRSKTSIVDGEWHRIAISRRQRRTRMTVDDGEVQESFSPVGSTVVNLHRLSQKLIIGAKVVPSDVGQVEVTEGVTACFKTISIDGTKVLKTRQGMKLFGAHPGCSALTSSPCSDLPCGNGGTCTSHGRHFMCECPSRYSGDRCEVDLEPCASHPCPPGIQCIPFYNDYLCKCPDGFTGKHCESRGFEDIQPSSCSKNVCGSGQCISIPRQNPASSDFICNCTGGVLQSTPCSDRSTTIADIFGMITKTETFIIILVTCILLLICGLVIITWKCCKRNSDPKYGAHCDVPHMRNTRVLVPANPPPLPPRGFRSDSTFMSTTNTSRPMVQVKPFSNVPELRDSRSPSACGSSKGTRRELPSDKFRRADELTSSNRVRHADRSSSRGADALTSLREGGDDWMSSIDERIDSALRYSRAAAGALIVGETELRPVVNDDDYMTMKPRKDLNFERDEPKPKIPAHAVPPSSVLYDDPISLNSQSLDDIDEEVNIHIS